MPLNTSNNETVSILCKQLVLCMGCQIMKRKGYVTVLNFSESQMEVFLAFGQFF